MKRQREILAFAVLGVVMVAGALGVTYIVHAQIHPPRDMPAFSFDSETVTYDATGGQTSSRAEQFSVRKDGSTARIQYLDNPGVRPSGRYIKVINLEAGVKFIAVDIARAYSASALMPGAADNVARARQLRCGPENAVRSVFEGYEVVWTQKKMTVGGTETVDHEFWKAPALGCQTLHAVTRKDGRVIQETFARNIRIGEPDPSIFEVPTGYTEMSPLQVWEFMAERDWIAKPNMEHEGLQFIMTQYDRNRPKQ